MSSWTAGLHDSHLSDRTDSYLDLRAGLLRNLLGATTREGFVEREASATFRRAVKLEADPVEVTGDLRQLQEIHRRIFQDVFVWAGQTRTDEIRKSDDYFMSPSVFATDGVKVFTDLAAEDLLVGIGTADFIERLAHHFNQLNASTRSAKAMVALSASSGVKSPSTPVILWIGAELTVQRMLTRRGLQWNAAIFDPSRR